MQPNKFVRDLHAQSKVENGFWGQIRRTVNGNPVSEENISMVVKEIDSWLNIEQNDAVIDLACGNRALTERLF